VPETIQHNISNSERKTVGTVAKYSNSAIYDSNINAIYCMNLFFAIVLAVFYEQSYIWKFIVYTVHGECAQEKIFLLWFVIQLWSL